MALDGITKLLYIYPLAKSRFAIMTPIQLLRILFARRRTILLVLLLVFGTALAITLILPKKYTAVATVVSDPKAPDPIYGYAVSNFGATTNTATQVDIIASDRVALRVVHMLGLDKDPSARIQWQSQGDGKGTVEQYFAGLLLKYLDVKPSRESDVISIQHTDSNPAFAAAVANGFAKAYVDVTLELRTDPARASTEFFEARTRQLREDLEKAQAHLSDFERDHAITVSDERLDVENSRLNELSSQLTAIQAQRAESRSRKMQAQGAAWTSPDVMQNPVIQQLSTDIVRAEGKLRELKSQLGPNNPLQQKAQAELDSLNSRLQIEMQQVAKGVSTTDTVIEQREAVIKNSLEDQRKRVLVMRAERDQAGVLEKDRDAAQKAYDLVAQRRSQTNLESLNQQTNVAVLSEAAVPMKPSAPRSSLNLLIGALVGASLGVVTALILELFDRRVRGAEDALQVFGLPILASLPSAYLGPAKGQRRFLPGARMLRLNFKRGALDAPL